MVLACPRRSGWPVVDQETRYVGNNGGFWRIISAAFSAIMIAGALMLPPPGPERPTRRPRVCRQHQLHAIRNPPRPPCRKRPPFDTSPPDDARSPRSPYRPSGSGSWRAVLLAAIPGSGMAWAKSPNVARHQAPTVERRSARKGTEWGIYAAIHGQGGHRRGAFSAHKSQNKNALTRV